MVGILNRGCSFMLRRETEGQRTAVSEIPALLPSLAVDRGWTLRFTAWSVVMMDLDGSLCRGRFGR